MDLLTLETSAGARSTEDLLRITAPSFVAGAVYVGERFVRAGPIIWRYAYKRSKQQFIQFCEQRRWQVEEL